ncbi:hypothetical protein AR158_C207R [Paramecium bursaria Chlorella virus AR158]|uniref:hypothetical protein n=1 Tax=Paramecium bursaria Chlorella virus AR158 TaxID=380598 RepID=UPI00015AA86E|nr:hypothetical protein AR158_C207R [Paramecium bursaria Chlorella virus AR158]ABU43753.1 hypothetical protein AR158_C207R [Paramecium bursaria Chlorella virus AR158]
MFRGWWIGSAVNSFRILVVQWNVQRIRDDRGPDEQDAREFMDCFEHAERAPSRHRASERTTSLRKTSCSSRVRKTQDISGIFQRPNRERFRSKFY